MKTVSAIYEQAATEGRLTPDPGQRAVLPAMDAVIARLRAAEQTPAPQTGLLSRLFGRTETAAPDTRGLYLWGGVGRGKSMLMDMLMAAAPDIPARRVHFHEFMQEIQAGLNAARLRGDPDAVRPVANAVADQLRLLCFDEMQITDIADAMIVGRLFQILFERGVVIVTTSNRVPDDLYKNGLNRQLFLPFIALIRDRMQVVELSSPRDHRQDRLAGAQVWFTGSGARAAMDVRWNQMTAGDQVAPLLLEVKGRSVTLPLHDAGVARAGFADLCGHALGPADYLAIAAAVDVLFIDDIPRLDRAAQNEAKRFVTLIDALYEAKVRVLASAEAEPEALYPAGEGAFEFERTASRLREMQDANWGR
ncbi:MAG: cell division protein ZapE [Paracoccus sp. (in: a-proteobacteria)]|uniref:cell division protein ZapE n=1 Tax=Paracoccus sp. TaxID=267 RepID=UPI0026DF777C|nr:cell division protein ZapE [Paracoccus sp. (in: a-proteobacteria)]MDO5621191.1 cell division protein ZapE [Paracoccus sp. (in: a-proteobacteria)]